MKKTVSWLTKVRHLVWGSSFLLSLVGGLFLITSQVAAQAFTSYPIYQHSYHQNFTDEVTDLTWDFTHNDTLNRLEILTSPTTDISTMNADLSSGGNWTNQGSLPITSNFSTEYKTVAGVSYVLLVYETDNYDISLQIGTINNSPTTPSISWSTAIKVLDGGGETDRFYTPAVTIGDDNLVHVAAVYQTAQPYLLKNPPDSTFHQQLTVIKSTTDFLSTPTFPAAGQFLGDKSSYLGQVILKNVGGAPTLILNTDGGASRAWTYQASTWTEVINSNMSINSVGGREFGANGVIEALLIDPAGNIYAGGRFTSIGGQAGMNRIAKLPVGSSTWETWGSGFTNSNDIVYDLKMDSVGNLYASGSFSSFYGNGGYQDFRNIIKLPAGSNTWETWGTGANLFVNAMVIDSADNLYVAGRFSQIGGVTARGVAKLPAGSSTWQSLQDTPSWIFSSIRAITIDSVGNLYVGGYKSSGGVYAQVAKLPSGSTTWESWTSTVVNGELWGLVVDSANNLYAAGGFKNMGGVAVDRIAKLPYGTSTWQSLSTDSDYGLINDIIIDGADNIYAVGSFSSINGVATSGVAKLNTATGVWTNLLTNPAALNRNNISSVALDGANNLWISAQYLNLGGTITNGLAQLPNGSSNWQGFGNGMGVYGGVYAMASDSQGTIYVGGDFEQIGGLPIKYLAKLPAGSTAWQPVVSEINAGLRTILIDDTDNIYIGGNFTSINGVAINRLAKLPSGSSTWQGFGTGPNNTVLSMVMDLQGNIFAAGYFANIDGVSANNIAKLPTGTSTWQGFGTGANSTVQTVALNPVTGDVVMGGYFSTVDGVAINRLAILPVGGSTWQPIDAGPNSTINALVYNSNGDLFAGGAFSTINGVSATNIAKLPAGSSTWQAISGGTNGAVLALAVDQNDHIYIGGNFTVAGGQFRNRLVRLNGGSYWQTIGSGADSAPLAFLPMANGEVFIGGNFTMLVDSNITYLARLMPSFLPFTNSTYTLADMRVINGRGYVVYVNSLNQLAWGIYDPSTSQVNIGSYITDDVDKKNLSLYFKAPYQLWVTYQQFDPTTKTYITQNRSLFNTNQQPVIALDDPAQDYTLYPGQKLVISGLVTDLDNQTLTISADIGGITQTVTVQGPTASTGTPWSLTWEADELNAIDSSFSNIYFNVSDGLTNNSDYYYGTITLAGFPPTLNRASRGDIVMFAGQRYIVVEPKYLDANYIQQSSTYVMSVEAFQERPFDLNNAGSNVWNQADQNQTAAWANNDPLQLVSADEYNSFLSSIPGQYQSWITPTNYGYGPCSSSTCYIWQTSSVVNESKVTFLALPDWNNGYGTMFKETFAQKVFGQSSFATDHLYFNPILTRSATDQNTTQVYHFSNTVIDNALLIDVDQPSALHPAFNLKSSIILCSGSGTYDDPYYLGDGNCNQTIRPPQPGSNTLESLKTGEVVKLGNRLFAKLGDYHVPYFDNRYFIDLETLVTPDNSGTIAWDESVSYNNLWSTTQTGKIGYYLNQILYQNDSYLDAEARKLVELTYFETDNNIMERQHLDPNQEEARAEMNYALASVVEIDNKSAWLCGTYRGDLTQLGCEVTDLPPLFQSPTWLRTAYRGRNGEARNNSAAWQGVEVNQLQTAHVTLNLKPNLYLASGSGTMADPYTVIDATDLSEDIMASLSTRFAGQLYYPDEAAVAADGYTKVEELDLNHQIWKKTLNRHPDDPQATISATTDYNFLIRFYTQNPQLGEIKLN